MPDSPVDEAGPARPLINATIFAALVYTLDAWAIGQGALAGFVGMIAIVVAVVRACNAGARRRGVGVIVQLGAVVIWVATITLTFASIRYQASRARVRAESVVAACRAFRIDHGSYPARLDDLVPAYLPSVPRAKYTLTSGQFTYIRSPRDEHTMLLYTEIPPFMHTSYDFEADRWSTLD